MTLLFEKKQKGFIHLSELEFTHDSTELKRVWLCARCSFISFGAKETNQRKHSPNQGLPPREGCNLLRPEAGLRKGYGIALEPLPLRGSRWVLNGCALIRPYIIYTIDKHRGVWGRGATIYGWVGSGGG